MTDARDLPVFPPAPDDGLTDRHREVLREAMKLVAERGYQGASLRELARRVGMRQPSLYHYFRSKEELVDQILDHMSVVFREGASLPPPARLEDVPPLLAHGVVHLYQHTDWGLFVRFIFSLSSGETRWRPRLRELFVDRSTEGLAQLMAPFVARGELEAEEADHFSRMILNAVGLLMLEQALLYPGEERVVDPQRYAASVTRFATAALAQIRRAPVDEPPSKRRRRSR